MIGIDPSFRVGEEGELRLLKQDVLDEMLEEHYAKDEEEFREFVEKYGTGRTDKKIEELILQLYEYSRSYPDPRQWLISCAEDYEIDREHLEDSRMVHTVKNVSDSNWAICMDWSDRRWKSVSSRQVRICMQRHWNQMKKN